MSNALIENLEKLVASGKDGALLRFGLGNAYAQSNEWPKAIEHLKRAVEIDPLYSAAWKLLGKSLAASGDREGALGAYQQGIRAAEQKGDKQALKEMQVFARRLAKPDA
jgi:tetratricopeptide (TPR) repeat protein